MPRPRLGRGCAALRDARRAHQGNRLSRLFAVVAAEVAIAGGVVAGAAVTAELQLGDGLQQVEVLHRGRLVGARAAPPELLDLVLDVMGLEARLVIVATAVGLERGRALVAVVVLVAAIVVAGMRRLGEGSEHDLLAREYRIG